MSADISGDEEEWYTEELSSISPDKTEATAPMYHSEEVRCAMPMYDSFHELRPNRLVRTEKVLKATGMMYDQPPARHTEKLIIHTPTENPPPVNSVEVINGWDINTYNTVKKWRDDIAKSSFIYGQLLGQKEKSMQAVLVFTLILSQLMFILSGVSTALTVVDIDMKWAMLTFNIIILIASGVVTVLNGLIKIFGWDTAISILTKIITKLDSQWFVFETEISIPAEQRINGKDFIKRSDGDYMHLMQSCPHVGIDDYVQANKTYQERLGQNLIWQARFNRQLDQQLDQQLNSNTVTN